MAVHSPYGVHYGAPVSRSRSEGDAYQRPPLDSLAVTSTSPPCIPKMPPSPRTARPQPSILRNPLPAEQQRKAAQNAHSPPSILKALPGRRRSSVVVEVVHSPPPPDFDGLDQNGDSSGVDESATLNRISTRDLSSSADSDGSLVPPPPLTTHGNLSPATESARGLAFSPGASSVLTDSSAGSARSDASSVKFAPLPPGRRGTPNTRTARYAGPQLWYEGGALPEDVYTWKDAQKGLSKLFKRGGEKGKSDKGKEVAVEGGTTGRPDHGRSASVPSITKSADPEDARRMEREAKGKVREIEHIEEVDDEDAEDLAADVEDNVLVKLASPSGPAVVPFPEQGAATAGDLELSDGDEDEEDGTSASEVTSPRTPPEHNGLHLSGMSDSDLDVERRRVIKGKGKAIDDAEHGEVRVAS
ncbi:hypothetical protein JCM3774_006215 [Rhodotorula dairenensis]